MARDPYQYFRIEARELVDGLGQGVLQLEKGAGPDLAASLLRLAHTLKGAARVVKQAGIAEKAHAIEDALGPLRDSTTAMGPERIEKTLQLLDAITADLVSLDGSGAPPATAEPGAPAPARPVTAASTEELARTVRADVGEMDMLLGGVAEASALLRGMRRLSAQAERARRLSDLLVEQMAPLRANDLGRATAGPGGAKVRALAEELRSLVSGLERGLTSGFDQAERQMQEVRATAEGLRLLPASALFVSLERTARDAAHALGKRVGFEASGRDIRVDAHVLGAVQPALVQMVRNAVAHGIESPADRAAAGKPRDGTIALEVARRGSRVAFTCRDDGRGLDLPSIKRAAERKGLLGPGATPDEAALIGLLLQGGLTTSRAVSEVAGRGIGLDIVRDAAAQLSGEVTARTERGKGTALTLLVPVSLSSLEALMVEAGGVIAAIPLDAVKRTARLALSDIARTALGDSISHEGRTVPFLPLTGPLKGRPVRHDVGAWTAVVIEGESMLAAVGVDRLLGTANVVVNRLPTLAPADAVVAGATFDAEGVPQLVLDPVGLAAAASRPGRGAVPAEAKPPASILVIDDSLTTRMMEQSILESAGYHVDLATSAEEGLEKARQRPYQLFLVDVEMPGMDGFTFVERTRADATLGRVPAILVTSRDAPDDRRRGREAGAHAHIAKGEFDQGRLLDIIGKLVG